MSKNAILSCPSLLIFSVVFSALPSGVGFLGGALIWKGSVFVNGVGEVHQVNGLTTAASGKLK